MYKVRRAAILDEDACFPEELALPSHGASATAVVDDA